MSKWTEQETLDFINNVRANVALKEQLRRMGDERFAKWLFDNLDRFKRRTGEYAIMEVVIERLTTREQRQAWENEKERELDQYILDNLHSHPEWADALKELDDV